MTDIHPLAGKRSSCPRVDGHYVPVRCQEVYHALKRCTGPVSYDRLVELLGHSRHMRKLRELRELNREYDSSGRMIYELVITRPVKGKKHVTFELNRSPRRTAGDSPAEQPWGSGCRWGRENPGRGSAMEIDSLLGVD